MQVRSMKEQSAPSPPDATPQALEVLPAVKRYCITRTFESVERGYVTAENETHARVLAERHWGDQEKLKGPVVPASETTNWQVRELLP